MGGSASKSARRLPSAASSSASSAASRSPLSNPSLPSRPPAYSPPGRPAAGAAPQAGPSQPIRSVQRDAYVHPDTTPAASRPTDPRRVSDMGASMAGMGAADVTGKSGVGFSGEKDAALMKDAQDPHFMANLSRLGPVQIQDAGKFVKSPPLAQRTLSARSSSPLLSQADNRPPAGHLSAAALVDLLDALKSASSRPAAEALYKQHGVDPARIDRLRRWVNSISVGREVRVVDEKQEVKKRVAVWVDGPAAANETAAA